MSRPIVDYKGRRRSKTIAFRVSPEEDEVINALVAASGMTKQDYITSRLECRDINVNPNVRVYRMLRDQMKSVYAELRRLRSADGIDERLIELMQVLTRVFIDLGADELGAVGDDVAQQDAAVLRMAAGSVRSDRLASSLGIKGSHSRPMRSARAAMLFRFLLPPERKGESGKTKRPPGFGKPTARWGEERAFASSLAGRGRRCGPDATRRGKGLRHNRTEVTMNTNLTLQDRAVKAAARFLEIRGYETLATGWKSPETRGTIDLVARDPESDDLVFVDVSARPNSSAGFGDGRNDRETMELLAVSWLAENDFAESVGVRFDKISMIVVGEDRALLRHHINAFGEA